jgi:hypothetical protein
MVRSSVHEDERGLECAVRVLGFGCVGIVSWVYCEKGKERRHGFWVRLGWGGV